MQRDEVGGRIHVVGGLRFLDAEFPVALGAHVRVVRDHPHPEPERAVGHELPDPAETEDAEGLLVQLDAGELRSLPLPAGQRRMRLGHVPRQRQQQRHRVLGCGDHVRLRRVGDDDAALGRRRHVDVVDADPGPSDGAQARCVLEQLGVELGRRADQDPVVVADLLGKLLAAPVDAEVDVEVAAEQLDPGVADLLGDEHPRLRSAVGRAHELRSRTQSMHAVSACTSAGSVAGNIATRS